MASNFALVAMSEKVRVILEMTGVDTLLPSYPTAADAETRILSHQFALDSSV